MQTNTYTPPPQTHTLPHKHTPHKHIPPTPHIHYPLSILFISPQYNNIQSLLECVTNPHQQHSLTPAKSQMAPVTLVSVLLLNGPFWTGSGQKYSIALYREYGALLVTVSGRVSPLLKWVNLASKTCCRAITQQQQWRCQGQEGGGRVYCLTEAKRSKEMVIWGMALGQF